MSRDPVPPFCLNLSLAQPARLPAAQSLGSTAAPSTAAQQYCRPNNRNMRSQHNILQKSDYNIKVRQVFTRTRSLAPRRFPRWWQMLLDADIGNIWKRVGLLTNNVGRCLYPTIMPGPGQRKDKMFDQAIFQTKLFWHTMAESVETSEVLADEDDRKLFVGGLPQVTHLPSTDTCWSTFNSKKKSWRLYQTISDWMRIKYRIFAEYSSKRKFVFIIIFTKFTPVLINHH